MSMPQKYHFASCEAFAGVRSVTRVSWKRKAATFNFAGWNILWYVLTMDTCCYIFSLRFLLDIFSHLKYNVEWEFTCPEHPPWLYISLQDTLTGYGPPVGCTVGQPIARHNWSVWVRRSTDKVLQGHHNILGIMLLKLVQNNREDRELLILCKNTLYYNKEHWKEQ